MGDVITFKRLTKLVDPVPFTPVPSPPPSWYFFTDPYPRERRRSLRVDKPCSEQKWAGWSYGRTSRGSFKARKCLVGREGFRPTCDVPWVEEFHVFLSWGNTRDHVAAPDWRVPYFVDLEVGGSGLPYNEGPPIHIERGYRTRREMRSALAFLKACVETDGWERLHARFKAFGGGRS